MKKCLHVLLLCVLASYVLWQATGTCFAQAPGPAPAPALEPQMPDTLFTATIFTDLGEDTLDIRQVQIANIYIRGNEVTKKPIIVRELDIEKGQRLPLGKLRKVVMQDRNKIFNLRLFHKVTIDIVERQNDRVDVMINLTERWYIFPLPIFELADRNFNDWFTNQGANLSRVEWGVKYYQYNVRGRNEQLALSFQLGFTEKFRVRYDFPYIDKAQKNGISVLFDYSENNSIAYATEGHKLQFINADRAMRRQVKAEARWTHRASFYNFHRVDLGYVGSRINDTIAQINPSYLLEGQEMQRYFRLAYRFRRDLRDVAAYPLKGRLVQGEFEKLGLGLENDVNIWRMAGEYRHFWPLGSGFYVSTSLRGAYSFPRVQPYNLLTGLGYRQNLIRGYELFVVEGQGYLLHKSTLRKRVASWNLNLGRLMPIRGLRSVPFAIYLKAYYDQGAVHLNFPYPLNTDLSNTYLGGGGFGLDIVSFYDAVFRVEYSFTNNGNQGLFINFRSAL